MRFELKSPFEPVGDQPEAIRALTDGLHVGKKYQTLQGVTGSGKTFTMASVIANVQHPTLVLSHSKTLAEQLYREFTEFFPHNAVRYFVSDYKLFQPQVYMPRGDVYIGKRAVLDKQLTCLRMAAVTDLLRRRDVIVVASVSAIFGVGSAEDCRAVTTSLAVGEAIERDELVERLELLRYKHDGNSSDRGTFRVCGDSIEVFPTYEENAARIECRQHTVKRLSVMVPESGEVIGECDRLTVYPAYHFALPKGRVAVAVDVIKQELNEQLEEFRRTGKQLEAQRLAAQTQCDIDRLLETGRCLGIENYSRPLGLRPPSSPSDTLLGFFPDDFLVFVDESHVTVPQIRGLPLADRSRKLPLVEHGFRLPCALDERPLSLEEFEERTSQLIYVSATPGPYELEKSGGMVVEQIVRPTGLLDPEIEIVPAAEQVPHLLKEIRRRADVGERVLVTTLTKREAEELAAHFEEQGIRAKWLHSELGTRDRVELLEKLRRGDYDVLVGVNLLREGLDLPEVSLVAVLDADEEGLFRSETALTQVIGRAARNVNGKAVFYADTLTGSMTRVLMETRRRRAMQEEHNRQHGIIPETISQVGRRGDRVSCVDDGASAMNLNAASVIGAT